MPDYTVVNLISGVENLAPKFGMQGVEARFARTTLALKESGLSYFALEPDTGVPFGHRHERQEEIYVVLEGGGTCRLEDETVELGPMDAIRVPPEVARGFRAGPQGARLLAFGAPQTEGQDAQMLPEFWDG